MEPDPDGIRRASVKTAKLTSRVSVPLSITMPFARVGTSALAPVRPVTDETASRALAVAFQLYLLFIASWWLRLPERFLALGLLHFDAALVVVISALIAFSNLAGNRGFDLRTNRLILLLVAYVMITLPFVQWPGSVVRFGIEGLIKALVFYYFTVRLTTTERKVSQLLFVFVACQAFRVLEPVYLHVTEGYWGGGASMGTGEVLNRLKGSEVDVIGSNGLAFVILSVIPFAHYLWTSTVIGRLAYLALLPCLLYALVLTASRSGMLGLVITFLVIWVQSRHKLLLAVLMVVTVSATVPRLPADLADRYASIVSSETKNAETARGRLEGTKQEFYVAMQRPLFGHGLGTSRETNANFGSRDQLSHNLIVEVLQELGFVGLVIFSMLLFCIGRSVRRALRALRESSATNPLVLALGLALQVWFAQNLLSSLFTYGLSNYQWYFMGGLADVTSALLSSLPHRSPNCRARRGALDDAPARLDVLETSTTSRRTIRFRAGSPA